MNECHRDRATVPYDAAWSNPFSTHHVGPGKVDYLFRDTTDREQFEQALRRHGWWGQIVGPHGSGKTTLLRGLGDFWERCNRDAVIWKPSRRPLRRPCTFEGAFRFRRGKGSAWHTFDEQTQLIVDGWEQLSRVQQVYTLLRCRMRKMGLLVTSHASHWWLPVIYRTETTVDRTIGLVRMLTDIPLSESTIRERFLQANGNVRETWMFLYDDVERWRAG